MLAHKVYMSVSRRCKTLLWGRLDATEPIQTVKKSLTLTLTSWPQYYYCMPMDLPLTIGLSSYPVRCWQLQLCSFWGRKITRVQGRTVQRVKIETCNSLLYRWFHYNLHSKLWQRRQQHTIDLWNSSSAFNSNSNVNTCKPLFAQQKQRLLNLQCKHLIKRSSLHGI